MCSAETGALYTVADPISRIYKTKYMQEDAPAAKRPETPSKEGKPARSRARSLWARKKAPAT